MTKPKPSFETAEKVKAEDTTPSVKSRKGRPAGGVFFPHNSLTEALKIPTTIWDNGAGKPFALQDVANYTKGEAGNPYSPTSFAFAELIRSANRYGLIEGSFQQKVTATISLSPLGKSIVAPTTNDDVNASTRAALETPEVFRGFLASLHGKVIPPEQVCINTLMADYHVRREDSKLCYDVIMRNIAELNLTKESQGKRYLRLDNLSVTTALIEPDKDDEIVQETDEAVAEASVQQPKSEVAAVQRPKQIFIAHGTNKKPLEQLVHILKRYNIPHIVANDEPHKGRPVGVKVAQEMKKCTSGIFIFTADEETKDPDGKVVMRPRDNVVYELGAGSVLYEDKIIILREEGVELPSDFSEVGRVTFEKDNLNAKGLELMTELAGLDIIKFTVT